MPEKLNWDLLKLLIEEFANPEPPRIEGVQSICSWGTRLGHVIWLITYGLVVQGFYWLDVDYLTSPDLEHRLNWSNGTDVVSLVIFNLVGLLFF